MYRIGLKSIKKKALSFGIQSFRVIEKELKIADSRNRPDEAAFFGCGCGRGFKSHSVRILEMDTSTQRLGNSSLRGGSN